MASHVIRFFSPCFRVSVVTCSFALTWFFLYGKVVFMYILGIETSTKTGSVAIVSNNGVIAQYSLNIEVTHSERLMSTVDRVLKDTGLAIADFGGFAVAIGPGYSPASG